SSTSAADRSAAVLGRAEAGAAHGPAVAAILTPGLPEDARPPGPGHGIAPGGGAPTPPADHGMEVPEPATPAVVEEQHHARLRQDIEIEDPLRGPEEPPARHQLGPARARVGRRQAQEGRRHREAEVLGEDA